MSGTKNTLSDLNNHLFAQMERLSEEKLKGEDLERELRRSGAVTNVAKEIISNARLVLDAKVKTADIPEKTEVPRLLT